jgi:hypothetical protein
MMFPLMTMFAQGGGGQAMEIFAKQFALSQADMERAANALMPAFSEGLRRSVSDPSGFLRFMAGMASGNWPAYFNDPSAAATERGRQAGEEILSQIFGSREVSRAIAAQAAQVTGFSQELFKQMMPMMAPVLLGGIFTQMVPQPAMQASHAMNPLGRILEEMMGGGAGMPPRGMPGGSTANPWGQILEEMMRNGERGASRQQPRGSDDPWGQILEEMMRGGRPAGVPSGRDPARGERQMPDMQDNPFGRMLEEILGGGGGRQQTGGRGREGQSASDRLGDIFNDMLKDKTGTAEPEVPSEPVRSERSAEQQREEKTASPPGWRPSDDGSPSRETRGGLEDLFGKMFESGTAMQRDYQQNMQKLFDQLLGDKPKR